MNNFEEILIDLNKKFNLRGYQESTIKLYTNWLIGLFKFYPTTKPTDICEQQINSYILILVNRKLSYSSVNQFIQASEYYFNEILKKGIKFNKRILPAKKERNYETLTQEQVFLIIDSINNLKHKCIVSLIYSCGLELSEIINLKSSDINSKSKPAKLIIREKNFNREVVLSEKVLYLLREYWRVFQPGNWLFEGQGQNSQYSITSARKVIKNAFESAGFRMEYEVKVLKNSYIKHLVELGVPLITVLDNYNIKSYESVERYSKIIYGEKRIDFSPYDRIILSNEFQSIEIEDLEKLALKIKTLDEKLYLIESITCFRVGALRAGIVFAWSALVRNLQNKCIEKGFNHINGALKKHNPSSKELKSLEDFETVKEKTLLMISFELNIISKHQRIQLENNLDLRNHCGHPSSYTPELNKSKAFIEDIVNIMRR